MELENLLKDTLYESLYRDISMYEAAVELYPDMMLGI
jgi:hypothetical protein